MARLEEVCDILDSKRVPITAKDRVAGPYPYYGANGVQDYVADYLFDDELVLLAEDGGHFGSGDKPIAYRVSGKCWVNNHAHVLKAKECIDVDYLCYSLMYRDVSDIVNGATRQKLTQADMRKIDIPMLPLAEQKTAVAKISKVFDLIALRKEQLAKLDELVKARFVEMFGDPIQNTQNRPTTDFVNVVMMQRGFDLPVQERNQNGQIPVYGSNGVLDRHDNSKVQGGGVITGRSGTIGKVFYTEGDYWPLNTALFSVNTHGNNVIYLAYLLEMYDLSRFTEGTGVPTLNRNKFHNKPIIDVPLAEQEIFAAFVEQTNKTKLTIQASLDKLEVMKKALMQEYFG